MTPVSIPMIKKRLLHECSAQETNSDHRKPRRHLRQAPRNIGDRKAQVILSQETIKRVPNTLIRLSLLICLLGAKRHDVRGSNGGTVEGNVANSRCRARLIGERTRDRHVIDGRRSGSPGVAEQRFVLAVKDGEVGRSRRC